MLDGGDEVVEPQAWHRRFTELPYWSINDL